MATDFSSLDKLVEFGVGMSIATQMMQTMNTVIARTSYPGVCMGPAFSQGCDTMGQNDPEKKYYLVVDENVAGPFDENELSELISKEKVNAETFCWMPGMNSWRFASHIPEVNKLLLLNS